MSPNVQLLGGGREVPWLDDAAVEGVRAAEPFPFEAAEYAERLAKVRTLLAESGADGVLVFRPSSVEWLCGYHSAETVPQPLLVTQDELFLYVLDLEIARALASSTVDNILYCTYSTLNGTLNSVARHVTQRLPGSKRVIVEFGHTSTPPQMLSFLDNAGCTAVDGDYLVEQARLVLSPAEIACVERAAAHTQRGVDAAVRAAGERGATDSSVAAAIAAALVEQANSRSAWGPVVATGERGGIAHSSFVAKPLHDEATFVEFAGTHHRYHAPTMRTLVRGTPSERVRRLRELSTTALAAVLEHARAGVTAGEVAAKASAAIGPLRDDEVFHHMFGYPVGLAHPPHWMDSKPFYLTANNHAPLEAGMVFHIPASFRSFGRLGVGLSHTFVVEERGGRPLTHGTADIVEL